jgi:hypothetical protein
MKVIRAKAIGSNRKRLDAIEPQSNDPLGQDNSKSLGDDVDEDVVDSASGFAATETYYVESWIAGWVPRNELEEGLRDWADYTDLECGHRVLLFVFPRSPHSHHVFGLVRSAFLPEDMATDWDSVFAELGGPGLGSGVASSLHVTPVRSSEVPQEVMTALMRAMMLSVPQWRMGMAPFIVDKGELFLSKPVPIENKSMPSEGSTAQTEVA